MNSAEFEALEARRSVKAKLAEAWHAIARKIEDGRPGEAVPILEAAIQTSDDLGADFTLSDHPVCLACKGYAEMPSPIESDRRVRCQDTPSVCKGNKYGRMHPVQLRHFLQSLIAPVHTSEEIERATEEPTPEPGEPQPTVVPIHDGVGE